MLFGKPARNLDNSNQFRTMFCMRFSFFKNLRFTAPWARTFFTVVKKRILKPFMKDNGSGSGMRPETEEVALNSIEGGSCNGSSNSNGDDSSKLPILRKIWAEGSECVEHIRRTFFSASVPLEAPGSFRTTKIELAWVLKFEFNVGSDKVEWRYPIEVMSRTYAKKSRAI